MRCAAQSWLLLVAVLWCISAGCRPTAHDTEEKQAMPESLPSPQPGEAPEELAEIRGPEQAGYAIDAEWQERVDGLDWRSGADALAVDAAGNLYVQSFNGNYIRKIGPTGESLAQWKYPGHPGEGCDYGTGIEVGPAGELVYALTHSGHIQVFSADGRYVETWRSPSGKSVSGIAVDEHFAYVAVGSSLFSGVLQFCTDGSLARRGIWSGWGDRQYNCSSMAVDPQGRALYLVGSATAGRKAVQRVTNCGELLDEWGETGSGRGAFRWPRDIAVDAAGHIFVADSENSRIQKLTRDGEFLTAWGTPGDPGFSPYGIDVDAAGNVYVLHWSQGSGLLKFRPLER